MAGRVHLPGWADDAAAWVAISTSSPSTAATRARRWPSSRHWPPAGPWCPPRWAVSLRGARRRHGLAGAARRPGLGGRSAGRGAGGSGRGPGERPRAGRRCWPASAATAWSPTLALPGAGRLMAGGTEARGPAGPGPSGESYNLGPWLRWEQSVSACWPPSGAPAAGRP